jgi:outer membrane protein OmpA-like peptidoglycan-associated protein
LNRLFLILITVVFFGLNCYSQTLVDLRADLTPELYKQYDAYIRKYAPADSAYYVVLALSNKHFAANRAAVSAFVFDMYKPLFPNLKSIFENEIPKLEQIMLTQTASPDMFPIYGDYIRKYAPTDDAYFAMQRIADYYIQRKEWDSATIVYRIFENLFPLSQNKINKTIELLNQKEFGLEVKNLGSSINTIGSEWDPSPTSDGRFLYFTADYRNKGWGGADIWVSEKKEGKWQNAENIGKPINNYFDETVDNVTTDGTGLLLSGNFQGSYGEFDIYLAEKTESGWADLLHYSKPINSEYHDESGCISADGNVLMFTSDRPGGIGPLVQINQKFYGGSTMGNMDIYVSLRTETGWGEPINLGSTINTPYSERAAYLHPDGKTMYFSSNGHYGLGRLDVFKSVRLSDTSWTQWSEPVNLGKEINSAQDDWGYVVDPTGEIAYFAKDGDINGFGNWDIYSIKLPDIAKPNELAIIKGKITDSLGRGLECIITWEDLETGERVGNLRSDPRDGFYIITLPLGKNYGYFASRPGFYPSSKNIDLRVIDSKIELIENITLISIKDMQEKGSGVRINNIFFDFDKSDLKEESIPELKRLLEFVNQLSAYKIIIEGHTDNSGSVAHNNKLSTDRAKEVAKYLTDNGIDSKRIIIKGLGSQIPLAPNDTEQNKALNRRVEIRLRK